MNALVDTSAVEQLSDAWFSVRAGHVTASRIADLMAKTRSGWGASRDTYMGELVAERLTGKPAERFQNDAMKWGVEHEPEARSGYEFLRDVSVTQVGFVKHPRLTFAGASPDGLVGDDGLVEIKCPQTSTHISTLLSETVPDKYMLQMQFQMACTLRQWCDFVSYDPRMAAHMRLFVKRVPRDEARIAEITQCVQDFLREVAGKVLALQTKYPDVRAE